MQSESRQPLLSSLLSYYGEGNFITFKKVCEIAYPDARDSYFYSNLFTALNVAGFIEIKNNYTSLMRWYSSTRITEGFIVVESLKSKIMGTTNEWYRDSKIKLYPLIIDQNNDRLIEGSYQNDFVLNKNNYLFNKDFFNRLPNLPVIEKNIGYEEKMLPNSNVRIETFNCENKRWIHVDYYSINEPSLIRITKEFTGIYYYIVYPEINLYYRIQNPEWGLIVAAAQLRWDVTSFFKFESNNLIIDTQFKIPTLILRNLFSASERLKIGAKLEFININEICANSFFNYMSNILGIISCHY